MSDKVTDKNLVEEMSNSFLDYAMTVIVSRALPDVRDGLKPVHRRILFAMNDLGNYADKPYKKSARIVGDVIGKYHPHGDSSVYSAMVRMSQDFAFRKPLVDGHGNFGSLDGDGAAAMRYTEARMSKMGMELLRDIQKKTVDYRENYDASEMEPVVLPSKFPNLLVNGSSGIAVGMATSIPPHNLSEVIDGVKAYIKNPDISPLQLMEFIKGPDFPLGGQLLGTSGIVKAYETGNGSVKVRANYEVFEEKNGKFTIIFSDIPFQVNKATLVEKIADNVKNKRIEGITDLRDESDRDGIRIVIETSRNASAEVIINQLFKYTALESNFSINMLALVNGEPKVLKINEVIMHYLNHQIEIIERRTQYDLTKAEKRAHILRGLIIALNHIDKIIETIKISETQEIALNNLMSSYELDEIQAKSILEMQLRRLTGLEQEKVLTELAELEVKITELLDILEHRERVYQIIEEELTEIQVKYGDDRRTEIITGYFDSSIDYEDLIEEEDTIVTLTESGYIKRLKPDTYKVQNRGGKGLKGMNVNDSDSVKDIMFTSTHTDLLFFTESGKVYKCRTHRIPEMSRTAKGIPLVNLIDIDTEDVISNIVAIKEYSDDQFLFFVTQHGIGKKTSVKEYEKINKNGKIAIGLNEGDIVVEAFVVTDEENMIIASEKGKAIVSQVSDYRMLARSSKGVRAMRLDSTDKIIGGNIFSSSDVAFTITENGYGKATQFDKYRIQTRGGKGSKNINVTEKNGNVKAIKILSEEEFANYDLVMISEMGQLIKLNAASIKVSGRATLGVRMMTLAEGDKLSNIELTKAEEVMDNVDVSRETVVNDEK